MHLLIFSFSGIKLFVATDRLPATFFFNITNANAQIEHATPSGTRGRDARAVRAVRTREPRRLAGSEILPLSTKLMPPQWPGDSALMRK